MTIVHQEKKNLTANIERVSNQQASREQLMRDRIRELE
jgi:hypothetical protein